MDNITVIRNFMADNNLDYLLVNTTNQFLVEYNTLVENSIYKLTNFSGSTGEVLVTPDKIYLFVDGRYHIQADNEVCHEIITVVKLSTGLKFIDEILKKIPKNFVLGMFSKKISQSKFEEYSSKNDVKLLNNDPLDTRIDFNNDDNVVLDISKTGLSTDDKIKTIREHLKDDEELYVTDLDEVSYLFNIRNYKIQDYSAKIKAKAIVSKNDVKFFDANNLDELEKYLATSKNKIYVDKSKINAYDYSLIKNPISLSTNYLKDMKSKKNDVELNLMIKAFNQTDKTVSAVRKYILSNDNLSEYDISKKLVEEFYKNGAVGLSFKPIVAIDENSALAHYSNASKDKILKDGSLVLIDCGAYFDGGLATDITRVFIKGKANPLQKKIYTYTLKAFLLAFNTKLSNNTTGFEIDNSVRGYFNKIDLDGFVFNHGLGHGIGINVHEYPPNLSKSELAKVVIEDGMCFSIEPGLYKENYFGIRLENSCYCKDKCIRSFVNMNYEKELIDYSLLTENELTWLEQFEVL